MAVKGLSSSWEALVKFLQREMLFKYSREVCSCWQKEISYRHNLLCSLICYYLLIVEHLQPDTQKKLQTH